MVRKAKTNECETYKYIKLIREDREARGEASLPKCWTFAVKLGKIPPFFMIRKRNRWSDWVLAIVNLDGLLGLTPAGPVMMVHMKTRNDSIIAKNRLEFLGISVSEETHETDIQKWGVFVAKDYVNQEGREDDV